MASTDCEWESHFYKHKSMASLLECWVLAEPIHQWARSSFVPVHRCERRNSGVVFQRAPVWLSSRWEWVVELGATLLNMMESVVCILVVHSSIFFLFIWGWVEGAAAQTSLCPGAPSSSLGGPQGILRPAEWHCHSSVSGVFSGVSSRWDMPRTDYIRCLLY